MKSLLSFFLVGSVVAACTVSNVSVGGDGDAGAADSGATDGAVGDAGTCSLPKVVGPCEAAMPRFWFNAATGQCEPFTYGGCGGNANNFESAAACAQACAPTNVTDAGDGGAACKDTAVARLCVRGTPTGGSGEESLTEGGAVKFQVYPAGCHSSSCTKVVEASCAVQKNENNEITLGGKFCLAPVPAPACTPDCSGGGFGSCDVASAAAGTYKAKLGTLEVTFTVPSTIPAGGNCVGSP